MSLVNIDIEPGRALVCVDTSGENANPAEDCGIFDISKIAVLPHANIVLTARGVNLMLSAMYAYAAQTVPCTFDAIAKRIPALMKEVMGRMATEIPGIKLGTQEIALVGYCETVGRMRCIHFVLPVGGELQTYETDDVDAIVSPWDEKWGEPLEIGTPEAMKLVAAMQVRHSRSDFPGQVIGGRLLMAQVSKDKVSIQSLGDLP